MRLKVNSLKKLQLQFKDAIANSKYHEASYIDSLPIRENSEFSKQKRLEVYQNAYFYRIFDSLKEDFPETFKLLKDEEQEIRNFVETQPSQFHNLGEYSGVFPKYLSDKPELYELSLFEWKRICAFSANHLLPIEMTAFSEYTEEETLELTLELHPSLQLATKKGEYFLIYRFDGELVEDLVDLETYKTVENISKHLNISEIVEKIKQPENLFQLFAKLASNGLIVNIK